jgi:hypothetical protein
MHYALKFLLILLMLQSVVFSQPISSSGQLSGWLMEDGQKGEVSQIGLRYIPEFTLAPIIGKNFSFDAEFSFNTYTYTNFYDNKEIEDGEDFKAYRQWIRFSDDCSELRLGLQKVNFGSAALFRPLQWFDRLDPRDPLNLTDGVYGGLYRYYFDNNANIWLWTLYGNKELKGIERTYTQDKSLEFGGRVQVPLPRGEAALSYHHRRADLASLYTPALDDEFIGDEDRFGLDGKWDYFIGFWFEGSVVHRATELANMNYQHSWTLGADYTLGLGNGLGIMGEVYNIESSEELFAAKTSSKYTGGTLSYPVGLFDTLSAVYTYDNQTYDDYFQLTWQRTYDNFVFYLIGFANPDQSRLNGVGLFSGNGFQTMMTYNY